MVRAIDAQQTILQIHSMEKVQQIQQQHADMQQRYFQLQLSEQDRVLKEKVKKSEEADKAIIRDKEEHDNKRRGHAQGHEKNAELTAESEIDSLEEGGHINIKV